MSKKDCELCGNKARMYCESDEASLCWDCDTKVHCANFLVAKHSRNLLCHLCQSPTPWTASGPKLSPTLSVCTSCLDNKQESSSTLSGESVEENYETETDDDDDNDSEADDDDDSETDDDEEDAGNQVVPLSSSASIPSSPARSISSYETGPGPWKRSRDSEATSSASDLNNQILLRPTKLIRTDQLCESAAVVVEEQCSETGFKTDVQIVSSFLRFQHNLEFSQHV